MRHPLLAAAFLLSQLPSPLWGASPSLKLRVEPRVCLAPCTILVGIHVPSHPKASSILLIIEGPEYYANEQYELDDDTTFVPDRTFPDLPGGDYTVTVSLMEGTEPDMNDRHRIAGDAVNVSVKGEEPEPDELP